MPLGKVTSTMISFEKGHELIASLYFRLVLRHELQAPLRSVGPVAPFASRTVPDLRSTQSQEDGTILLSLCLDRRDRTQARAAPELCASKEAL